jgi:hypothetical protein
MIVGEGLHASSHQSLQQFAHHREKANWPVGLWLTSVSVWSFGDSNEVPHSPFSWEDLPGKTAVLQVKKFLVEVSPGALNYFNLDEIGSGAFTPQIRLTAPRGSSIRNSVVSSMFGRAVMLRLISVCSGVSDHSWSSGMRAVSIASAVVRQLEVSPYGVRSVDTVSSLLSLSVIVL